MLTYNIDNSSRYPLYEQIYMKIKKDISDGKLITGEKLPSKRELAKHLQISIITVENAYAQLIAEGYIYSQEKKGYYISDITKMMYSQMHEKKSQQIVKEKKEYFIDFVSNAIDVQGFPITIWSRLVREILSKENQKNILRSAPSQGLYELREAISKHLYQFRGMDVKPDNIVIGSGTEYLYNLLIQLLGNDLVFAVEDPGYAKPYLIYRSNKTSCAHISMDEQGIDMSALNDSNADIVHITPSHHFPTGIVMPISRRYELLNWAYNKKQRYIIEDDYDSEFRMSGRPIPSLLGIDGNKKVIYMNTFSKTIAPSIRISYMILPDNLMEKFNKELGFYTNTVPMLEQIVLQLFISRGYLEKHINRMKTIYRIKRDKIISLIKESRLKDFCEILEADSGLHFLLKTDTSLTDEEVIEKSKEKGIRISAVSTYSFNNRSHLSHTFIINYPGVEIEKVNTAIGYLEDILICSQ